MVVLKDYAFEILVFFTMKKIWNLKKQKKSFFLEVFVPIGMEILLGK